MGPYTKPFDQKGILNYKCNLYGYDKYAEVWVF